MKFVIDAISKSSNARVGTLKCLNRLPDACVETPMLFLYSKGGCIPHLTQDVIEFVTKERLAIQLPLTTSITCHQAVKEYKQGIGNFIGKKDCLIYCTVQDPAQSSPVGYNVTDKVSIWSRSGKEHVDADRYMEIMEAFCPDMYQCLGDGETNMNSTKKRIQKSIVRSLDLFHKCLQKHKESEVLKESGFLAPLQGGYDINSRINYAKEISAAAVDGFVIDGLHENGPDVEFLDFEKVKPVIRETIKELPEDKFRMVHGCWSPEAVLNLVEEGIDAFDSSFPFVVTERGAALTFPYKYRQLADYDASSTVNGTFECQEVQSEPNTDSCIKGNMYEINLEDKKFEEDFAPILKDCSCYSCKEHTRAYVHHLIINKELLAGVLLMMHNLHHYLEFFKEMRRAVKDDDLRRLRVAVCQGKRE